MTYALVGSLGTPSTSLSPSFGQATSAGSLLVAWLGCNSSSGTNPFSTSSTGWTVLSAFGGAFDWAGIAYKPNSASGETAPVFTAGGPSAPISMLGEFSGGALSSVSDKTGTGSGSGTQTATCSAADTQAGNLIIGVVYWNSPGGAATATDSITDTNGSSVTASHVTGQPGGSGTFVYDFVWGVAGAVLGGSGDSFTATLSAFSGGSSGIASFSPAGGGGGGGGSPVAMPLVQAWPVYQQRVR